MTSKAVKLVMACLLCIGAIIALVLGVQRLLGL
jgi:hypothetical protein